MSRLDKILLGFIVLAVLVLAWQGYLDFGSFITYIGLLALVVSVVRGIPTHYPRTASLLRRVVFLLTAAVVCFFLLILLLVFGLGWFTVR